VRSYTALLKAHSSEWFKALQAVYPWQTAHNRHILLVAGSEAVCSICGDEDGVHNRFVFRPLTR